MAIRKRRLNRKLAELTLEGGELAHLPAPWAFQIDCPHHGPVEFDFASLRTSGRDDLAAHFRDAVWQMRHVKVSKSLQHSARVLSTFFRFLDELAPEVCRLEQIDRNLLQSYVGWLSLQIRVEGKQQGHQWTIGARLAHYNGLKGLLVHLQRWKPEHTRNLEFPGNPFPNAARLMPKRAAYSNEETRRLTDALNRDLRALHLDEKSLSEQQILGVHLLVLALATGRNLQSLLELDRACLQIHDAPGRKLLVTWKRRGYSTHATPTASSDSGSSSAESKELAVPANIAGHIEWLARHTEPLSRKVDSRFASRIFLHVPLQGPNAGKTVPLTPNSSMWALIAFVKRHELKDDGGQPLALCISRLRPTFGNAIYARTGGDLRAVQRALNHADLRTTVNHYLDVPPNAERDLALVVEGMVGWARREIDGKVLIAADGRIPLNNVKDLLSGGYNTGVARCRNPFRDRDSVCSKFFTCFRCQNMVVFEDDLWRMYSFYYRLLHERVKVAPQHWAITYGPIIARIDREIAPQFDAGLVEQAKAKAMRDPHPMWRGPLL